MPPRNKQTPPRLAQRLLRRWCAPQWLEEVEGDLCEQFAAQAREGGAARARLVYWRDVLLYLSRPYLLEKPRPTYQQARGPLMWKNYLKIAARNAGRHPAYAFINVAGLAVGMACCILILMLVRHERSFDRFHTEAERIHRVLIQETRPDGSLDYRILMPPPLAPALAEEFQSIEKFTRVVGGHLDVRKGDELVTEMAYLADSTFFEIFSFPLLAGDPAGVLRDPQSAVLTQRTAEKYFGAILPAEALGRTLTIQRGDDTFDFTVTGVAAPLPKHSSLQFGLMLSFQQYEMENIYIGANDWGGRTSLYLLLDEEQDPAAFEAGLPPFTKVQLAQRIEGRRQAEYLAEGDDAFQLVLQPLLGLHHNPAVRTIYEATPYDPTYSYILAGIALLVLLIACINFTTLSIGRSTGRAREVGLRKVLGAYRGQLLRQFWGEALLLSFLSLLLGFALAALALPLFNTLAGKEFSLLDFAGLPNLLALGALFALVGLVAGGYPALVLTRFQPAAVLKGEVGAPRRSWLTRGLVVVQYTLSIGLIVCTLVMYQQLNFLLDKDLGFEDDQVVVVHTNRLDDQQERRVLEVFRNGMAEEERVANVVRTGYAFTHSYDGYGWIEPDGTPIEVHNVGADYDYVEVLGMEVVAGRDFDPAFPSDSTHSVLVNEAFVREYGIENPVGHRLAGLQGDSFFGDVAPTIIGVVKDFNFQSLHEAVVPVMINMHPDYYMGMNALLVKIRPEDVEGTLGVLERTWAQAMPDKPFVYTFMDEDFARLYEDERRWSRIVTYSSLFAILIACLGLFGLATLTVTRRTKEIGIRKVLGATLPNIAALVTREFVLLVGVAMVLAWPLAYFGMQRWLEGFAYHVGLAWWIFPAAGLMALSIALLAVSYHALRAAAADPVEALRYE